MTKGAGSKLWIYDTTNKKWVKLAGTAAGAMSIHAIVESLDDIEDVNIPVPVDGEVPTWDAGTEKWITGAPAPAAHAASHKFLGSDVLNIRALVASYLQGAWLNGWESLDGWTDLSTGGTVTLETPTVRLKTNATINQTAHIHSIGSQYFAHATASVRYILAMRLDFRSVFSDADAWFGWFHTKTDPTAVDDRIGFHIDTNQDIYAVEGNEGGTTSEDTGVNITGVGQKDFLILYDNGSTTFYIGGALVATITTNLVDADYMYPVFYVKTTENVNKEFVVMPFMSIPGEI